MLEVGGPALKLSNGSLPYSSSCRLPMTLWMLFDTFAL